MGMNFGFEKAPCPGRVDYALDGFRWALMTGRCNGLNNGGLDHV